jgi:hypothetical protein
MPRKQDLKVVVPQYKSEESSPGKQEVQDTVQCTPEKDRRNTGWVHTRWCPQDNRNAINLDVSMAKKVFLLVANEPERLGRPIDILSVMDHMDDAHREHERGQC